MRAVTVFELGLHRQFVPIGEAMRSVFSPTRLKLCLENVLLIGLAIFTRRLYSLGGSFQGAAQFIQRAMCLSLF